MYRASMRAVVIGASLAWGSHTMADPEVHMENVMGKAFMPAAAVPNHADRMSVQPRVAVAPTDLAPIIVFQEINRDTSGALLRGEKFKLEDTHDHMHAELERVRSRMAIMEQTQPQPMPIVAQNVNATNFGFGCFGFGMGATFSLLIIYKLFVKGSGAAPAISGNPGDVDKFQCSAAISLASNPSSVGLRAVGVDMSEVKSFGGSEPMRDPAPIEAHNRNEDLKMSSSASQTGNVVVPTRASAGDSSISAQSRSIRNCRSPHPLAARGPPCPLNQRRARLPQMGEGPDETGEVGKITEEMMEAAVAHAEKLWSEVYQARKRADELAGEAEEAAKNAKQSSQEQTKIVEGMQNFSLSAIADAQKATNDSLGVCSKIADAVAAAELADNLEVEAGKATESLESALELYQSQ